MNWQSYFLGLITPLVAVGLFLGVMWTYWTLQQLAENRGWTWELKTDRKPHEISDYDLRRYIWFERQRGPIFTGHWYREDADDRPLITRWLGIGSATGRSLMIYRKRELERT